MRVVILGGTGMIGRALVAALRQAGHEVVIFTRRPDAAFDGALSVVTKVRWQPDDTLAMARHLRGADAVVNLAGANLAEGRWTPARKQVLVASRVETTRALARALRSAQPRPLVLLQASAVGYYGNRGEALVDERTPPGEDFLARLCRDWEAASETVEMLGVRRVLLRTGVVLSRTGGALPRLLKPARWGLGGPLGSGRQWMPWIHLADEVAAILFLMTHPQARGPFNLTAPEPVRQRDLARALGARLGRPAFLPLPAFALKVLLGEMSQTLLSSQRVLPNRLLALGYRFRFPVLSVALDDLLA